MDDNRALSDALQMAVDRVRYQDISDALRLVDGAVSDVQGIESDSRTWLLPDVTSAAENVLSALNDLAECIDRGLREAERK